MSGKVALIVFDSVDHELIGRMLGEGRLPGLAGVLKEGVCAELRDVQDALTSPTSTTLFTGTQPPDHTVFGAHQLVPGSYRIEPAELERSLAQPPFWRHVSDAGLRSTVVSVYGTPLMSPFNGTQVVGWGSHDPYARDRWASDPSELVDTLEKRFGPRSLRFRSLRPRSEDEIRAYRATCLQGLEQQASALRHLARETDWDLFVGAFADCHQAGHYLWHLDRPEHPEHDPGLAPELRGALADIYAHADAGIAALTGELPAETAVLVVSQYSMCANSRLDSALAGLLEQAGFGRRGGAPPDGRARAIGAGRRLARALLPKRVRSAMGSRLGWDRYLYEVMLADLDWSATTAFALPGDTSSGVRLNVAGREPRGIVQRGSPYDEACAQVAEALGAARDADSGERLVARVVRFDELYGSEPPGPLPDLCVQWRRALPPRAIRLDGGPEITVPATDERTAAHRTPGFVALKVPGRPGSGSAELSGPPARLVDVAASTLALLGVEQPPKLAGGLLPHLEGDPRTTRP